jgi:RNA polymerase-binding transcription factor DksA
MTAPTPPLRPARPAIPHPRGNLTPKQLTMFRAMLDEQRRFRIDQLTAARIPAPTDAAREVAGAILQAARVALHDIDAALGRMADGTYGRCTHCGVALRIERLEILPQAPLCMECQRDAAH